jgi:putative component of membrane protein insertase Oxa1/YidC/SpoIIIJ protein YidD
MTTERKLATILMQKFTIVVIKEYCKNIANLLNSDCGTNIERTLATMLMQKFTIVVIKEYYKNIANLLNSDCGTNTYTNTTETVESGILSHTIDDMTPQDKLQTKILKY